MTDFYDQWLQVGKWTFEEAALIFNGKDPDQYSSQVNISRGIDTSSFKVKWKNDVVRFHRIFKKANWEKYAGAYKLDILISGETSPNHYFILAKDKQLKLPDELTKKWGELGNSLGKSSEKEDQNRPTEYTTSKLDILLEAKAKFWSLYDKAEPSTAPTNEQVVDWIKGQKDSKGQYISNNLATAMATILRDEALRTGPRK